MILLDANILIRAVLGRRRVRYLLDEYSSRGVRFFAPEVAFQDAEKYLPPLLEKRGKPASDVLPALHYLRQIIEIADRDLYAAFEHDARERLRGRDEHDWPVLASALALSCPIWSEDADFFGASRFGPLTALKSFLRAN